MRRSWIQAVVLSEWGEALTYRVEPGPSDRIVFPEHGPYSERLGYRQLPALLDSLQTSTYSIQDQARISPAFERTLGAGLYPVYPHKDQTGLDVQDRYGEDLFRAEYPTSVYASPDSIPRLVRQTLLTIENRELLDDTYPYKNPAIEWDRFAGAVLQQILTGGDGPGGSTLATQLAKVRHSPDGRTGSALEKLRQMASASLHAYRNGARTVDDRYRILKEYLNALPLAASPGHGEVNGLLDGLRVWYRSDPDRINALLADDAGEEAALDDRARAYRQVLSLILSTRSPSRFFRQEGGREALADLTDRYLPLMAERGVISAELRDAALETSLAPREEALPPPSEPFVARKAANAIRADLLALTGETSLPELDRYDLSVQTTFDRPVQRAVVDVLEKLHDSTYVTQQGLAGNRLLAAGDPRKVTYSVVLFEARSDANVLRVQADNFPGPFDVNRRSKLELGSTAKLRTLITYLELIERVWETYHSKPAADLKALLDAELDVLTRWTLEYCLRQPDASRGDVMQAAMDRTYSGSTGERFFTGGGIHVFNNFSSDTGGQMTVHRALQYSVNLVFIRMMRDVVNYHVARLPGQPASILSRPDDPRRSDYLRRFADQEGTQFVNRYFKAYKNEAPQGEVLRVFGERHVMNARRLAFAYRSIFPEASQSAFRTYIRSYATNGSGLGDADLNDLYKRANTQPLSWQDRGYLAGIHPLELWLVNYLYQHPSATQSDAVAASRQVRQDVYAWLLKKSKGSQDPRIRTLLEQEAFSDVHKMWSRLGYPFERLVPTYATSIGSSADRPAALGELAGIVLRDGRRYPTVRIDSLHFAADTPYETVVGRTLPEPEPVLSPELCQVVRAALVDVVEQGTAVRARGAFRSVDGTVLPVGGKTGTGDNRVRVQRSSGGQSSYSLNRTATFVFFAGDRFFGTVVAYVPGREAEQYSFTSSLPSTVLSIIGPSLTPLVSPGPPSADTPPPSGTASNP